MSKKNCFIRAAIFLICAACILALSLSSCGKRGAHDMSNPQSEPDPGSRQTVHIINPDSEVRGVWIASVFNIDYPSAADLSPEALRAELDAILDTCVENSLNTVFFQVRPSCDALYKSEIFPVSSYLSKSGALAFDPLEYIVTAAHSRNIFVHAWVNPLRVTVSGTDLSALPENSPARQNPEWTVPYADGKLYLNAGMPEVRQLVADGVREIVENYDVDGVVFDDYFYPYPKNDESGQTAVFDDTDEFEAYGAGFDSIADWRRDNINRLVELCYNTVHDADPECQFGISPCGIWQNDNGKNGGSATNGFEGYNSLYCDATAWIKAGTIDFISPQIYWRFTDSASAFDIVTRWWNAALDGSLVKLYISHASYRYEDGDWSDPSGELSEQISFARSEKAYRGSIFYGYDELNKNTNGASDDIKSAFSDEIIYMDIQSNGHGVTFSSPENGSVTEDGSTYIIGMSDPYYILTMDGRRVSRTKSGYFSVYVTLEAGENEFVFEQNGIRYLYKITYGKASTDSSASGENKSGNTDRVIDHLSITGTYPSGNISTSDEKLWVSCIAAVGSTVSVDIGGVITKLQPTETPTKKSADNGYIAVIYGASVDIPKADSGSMIDAGQIKYTASHSDGTVTADGANIRVLGENAPLAVTVLNDYTSLKITENSSYYNDYTVQSAGMTDYVTSQKNGYYKLRMGGYVAESDVVETDELPSYAALLEAAEVSVNGDHTEIRIMCGDKPAYNGCIDENGRFVVTFYNVDESSATIPEIKKNPLLKSCEVVRLDGKVRYSFELYDVLNFYGFDLHYEDECIVVSLKNPISLDLDSDRPLRGVRIALDAGHGGDEPGAAGPYIGDDGRIYEKDLNLSVTIETAFMLAELGAEVELTRESDTTVSLFDRMDYLEESEPDLSISIHQNSIGYTTDATRVRGTLGLWCMDGGRLLADCVGSSVAEATGRPYRGTNYQLLAMCRNPKFPQTLVEVGFMTCIEEYEQMTNGSGIKKAAQGICNGVLQYFAKQKGYCT